MPSTDNRRFKRSRARQLEEAGPVPVRPQKPSQQCSTPIGALQFELRVERSVREEAVALARRLYRDLEAAQRRIEDLERELAIAAPADRMA